MGKSRISGRPLRAKLPTFAFIAAALSTHASVWAQEGDATTPPQDAKEAGDGATDSKKDAESQPPVEGSNQEKGDAEPNTEAENANSDPATAPDDDSATDEKPETQPGEGNASEGGNTASEGDTAKDESSVEKEVAPVGPSTGATPAGTGIAAAFGAYPNPAEDQTELEKQGAERPDEIKKDRVFAEEWWSHTRPTLELHGNFRVRSSMYHNFSLNRIDSPESALWPRPIDHFYTDLNGAQHGAEVCTADEAGIGENDDPFQANEGCVSNTQMGANMRFRLEPTIVISDNLRVSSQIDFLGNLVMGSTAQGNTNFPAATGGYAVSSGSGYRPISATTNSAASPVSGVNSLQDAVSIRRAWAEYDTPFGQLKFGRMADHWGLGILRNAGDDIDGDQQSTVDRIAFYTGLPSMGLYAGGAWDFMDEGPTSGGFTVEGGQPYDLGQRDDLSRVNLMLFRRMDAQLEKLALAKGKIVVNGGLYLTYQWQKLANDLSGPTAVCGNGTGASTIDCQPGEAASGIRRRGFKMVTPDLYGEVKYKKFYAAVEFVTHQGKFDSLATGGDNDPVEDEDGWKVNQWAIATEIEQRLVEDKLKLGFYFGWASGDGDVNNLAPQQSIQEQIGDNTIETFRFHPGYRIDLILNRHLLSRVQGTYYFKPMAEYDFIRKVTGMRLGGRAEVIWTRASNFLQTPGHSQDLGIELNGTVYYQSKDGVQNDREDLKGGFYSMLQYGVLFPLSGLGYQENQSVPDGSADELKLKPAQTVRAFLGVAF